MNRILGIIAASMLFAAPALAQEAEEGRQIRYKERTEIDFDAVDVTGELVKPQGGFISERRKAEFNPLIRLRENFNDEMKRSVDEVK